MNNSTCLGSAVLFLCKFANFDGGFVSPHFHFARALRAKRERESRQYESTRGPRRSRIAKLAYDRVEDQIESAPLQQAIVTAGVFTDKFQLLSSDATTRAFNLNVKMEPVNIVEHFNRLHAAIEEKAAKVKQARKEEEAITTCHQLTLPGAETIADSSAETGLAPSNKHLKAS